ncbi:uncharacterized protein LOC128554010 [Mercenaria mercenaria]|uniref:uncharacterized protein LOC128554010 n=1 Tax=Mercenaria mercenaria TaxID=6596 RepID=UPI00234ECD94|nr:uncharacterized protein LOC128554010 [Mercenaria mercenaria]
MSLSAYFNLANLKAKMDTFLKRTPDTPKKYVYLLDPENGETTKQFIEGFKLFINCDIELKEVQRSTDCKDNLPIILLCRRQTDRAEEDINSTLKYLHTDDLYTRTALINIHVVSDALYLPTVPTTKKISSIFNKDLGIILDFGFVQDGVNKLIYPCKHDVTTNSKQAFHDFVTNK